MSMNKIIKGKVKKIVPEMVVVSYSDGGREYTIEVDSRKNTIGYIEEGEVVFLNPDVEPGKIIVYSDLRSSITDFGKMDKNLFQCEPVEDLVVYKDLKLNREEMRRFEPQRLGIKDSEFTLIDGRSRGGLTLNMAYNAAVKNKIPVGIFSQYMSRGELAMEIIRNQELIPSYEVDEFESSHDDTILRKITGVCEQLQQIPIYVDDTNYSNISELSFNAIRIKEAYGLKLLVIQDLEVPFFRDESDLMGNLERSKRLAEELSIPVIAMMNLSDNFKRNRRERNLFEYSELFPFHSMLKHADRILLLNERVRMRRRPRKYRKDDYVLNIVIAEKKKVEKDKPACA